MAGPERGIPKRPPALVSARLVLVAITVSVLRMLDLLISVRACMSRRCALGGMNHVFDNLVAAGAVPEDVGDARHDGFVVLEDARKMIRRWFVVATLCDGRGMEIGGVG